MKRPFFLDRDGVLNRDRRPCVSCAEEIELLPNVGEGLALLASAGFEFYVVSNQQAVERGLFAAEELPKMSDRIQGLLAPHRVSIRSFEYCTALAESDHPNRKPAPGMILDTAERFGLDLGGVFMVGDRWSDVEAAARAGLRPLLVTTGEAKRGDEAAWAYQPEAVFDDLLAVATYVLGPGT